MARVMVADLADWSDTPPRPASAVRAPPQPKRMTVDAAVEKFMLQYKGAADNTRQTYHYLLLALKRFAALQGIVLLDQFTAQHLRLFRDSWKVSPRTYRAKLSWTKTFFTYCVGNEWLDKNPVLAVTQPRTRASQEMLERVPFSDEELDRMFAACQEKYDQGSDRRMRWHGQDLADFISISVYTGLRISDVATFHIDRLRPGGDIHIRTTKTGIRVWTWVPPWLEARIEERARRVGPHIFGVQNTRNLNIVTKTWRDRLKRLWKLCGIWKQPPVPHRFRHTFARVLLQNGVPVTHVAELMGDTEAVVRKHYSTWVPERQERIRRVLQEAFDQKPMPAKVVAFPAPK